MRRLMTSAAGAILAIAGIVGNADAANYADTSFGISIDIDDALTKQPLMRDIQSFTTEDASGSLAIRRAFDLSLIEFSDKIRSVGYRDSKYQTFLRIDGNPVEVDVESGRGLLLPVQGQVNGVFYRGMIGAYSGQNGQGFLVIATVKPEYWDEWKPRMKAMFDSIKFIEYDMNSMFEQWQNLLKGKYLKPKQTYTTSYTRFGILYGPPPRNYHLCSDGTMARQPPVAGKAPGHWKVIIKTGEPYLAIRDGSDKEQLKLEQESDTLILGGDPYTIAASEVCQ